MPIAKLLLVLALLGYAAPARAEPTTIAQAIDAETSATNNDVFGDRAWLSPTAFTQPKGSLALAYHQLPAPMSTLFASWGVTDRVHLTAAVARDWDSADDSAAGMAAKIQILKLDRLAIAASGGAWRVSDTSVFSGGASGSYCIDRACRSLASLSLTGIFPDVDHEPPLVLIGGSLISHLSDHFRLVVEVDVIRQLEEQDHSLGNLFAIFYGLRATSRQWAADLGFMRPLDDNGDGAGPGIPTVSLAYRVQ